MATHGRGILIIDNIAPLRELTDEVLNSELTIFKSEPYYITNPKSGGGLSGDQGYYGTNEMDAATITYFMNKRHIFGDMFIDVYNSKGEKLQTLAAGKKKGINRVPLFIRMKPPRVKASSPMLAIRTAYGPTYPAGEYLIKIVKGEKTYLGKLNLLYDPDSKHTTAERDLQYKTLMKAYALIENINIMDRQVTGIQDQIELNRKNVSGNVITELEKVSEKMERIHNELVATNPSRLSGETKLSEKVGDIYGAVIGYQGRPTDSHIEGLNTLEKEFNSQRDRFDNFLSKDLVMLNEKIKKENLKEIKVRSIEELKKN